MGRRVAQATSTRIAITSWNCQVGLPPESAINSNDWPPVATTSSSTASSSAAEPSSQ